MTELRETIARAGFDAFWAEGTDYDAIEQAMWAQVADAVLAAIARDAVVIERGRAERLIAFGRAYDGFCDTLYDRVDRHIEREYADKIDEIDTAWAAITGADLDPLP